MHMSEFVFCQTQISMSHISTYENNFHLKLRLRHPRISKNRDAVFHKTSLRCCENRRHSYLSVIDETAHCDIGFKVVPRKEHHLLSRFY